MQIPNSFFSWSLMMADKKAQRPEIRNSEIFPWLRPPMPTRPPTWLKRWRHLVMSFKLSEKYLVVCMMQAVKLRIRSREWLSHQDPLYMEEKNLLLEKYQGPCTHDHIQRSGNRHGRFSKCLACGKKWRWSEDQQDPPRQKEHWPLPLPSSSTAASFQDPKYTPEKFMGLSTPPRTPAKASQWSITNPPSPVPKMPSMPTTPMQNVQKKAETARSKKRVSPPKRGTEEEEAEMSSESYEWDLVDAAWIKRKATKLGFVAISSPWPRCTIRRMRSMRASSRMRIMFEEAAELMWWKCLPTEPGSVN